MLTYGREDVIGRIGLGPALLALGGLDDDVIAGGERERVIAVGVGVRGGDDVRRRGLEVIVDQSVAVEVCEGADLPALQARLALIALAVVVLVLELDARDRGIRDILVVAEVLVVGDLSRGEGDG